MVSCQLLCGLLCNAAGGHRGYAFVEFGSIEDATAVMAAHNTAPLVIEGGARLQIEYTQWAYGGGGGYAPGGAAGVGGGGGGGGGCGRGPGQALDWVCEMCAAVNFARRMECYQCSAARTATAKRVVADLDGPSTILKV